VLLGNHSVLYKHPGRDIGGAAIGLGMDRGAFNKSSMARGVFNAVDWEPKSGVPDGYRPPYTWVIPQASGGLSSRNVLAGSGTFASSIAGGKNAVAALVGSGELTATGALIVQALAALTGSGTVTTASLLAILNAVADLAGSGTLAGEVEALGFLLAVLEGEGTFEGVPYATGELVADISVSAVDVLTSDAIAASVWNSLVANYDEAGTMGAKMSALLTLAKYLGLK
jgi:hypothetical protein